MRGGGGGGGRRGGGASLPLIKRRAVGGPAGACASGRIGGGRKGTKFLKTSFDRLEEGGGG